MRTFILLILVFISFLNLSGQTRQDTIHYFDNLFPKSGLFIRPDSLQDGTWIAFCETNSNQIGLKLHYKNGKRNGETISYWPNGNIQQKGFYQDGCLVGLNEKWYENGIKESESTCEIIDSKLYSSSCSEFNYWTNDGKQLIKDGTGKYFSYHDNGILQVSGAYLKGNQTGKWTWYYNNGNLQYVESFLDGKQDGEYVFYFINGKVRTKGTYSNGKQVGKWEDWYQNGKPRQTEYRTDGKLNGEANYWYANGQLYTSGFYKMGKEDGSWKYWNEEGTLEKEEIYLNGKLLQTKNFR